MSGAFLKMNEVDSLASVRSTPAASCVYISNAAREILSCSYYGLNPRFSTFFHDQPPPRPSTNALTPVRWTPFYQTLKLYISKSIGKDVINFLGALHQLLGG